MAVITLAAAKNHLNITVETHDAELNDVIASAVSALEGRVGPIEAKPGMTHRAAGGGKGLLLPTSHAVVSVQSVTEAVDGGSALTMGDLLLNARAGVITYSNGSTFPARAYDIVYTAGYQPVPADLVWATKEMVRHLWESQRGPGMRPGAPPSEGVANTIPGGGELFPYRVEQILRAYRPMPVY